jgi:hypothetical protein
MQTLGSPPQDKRSCPASREISAWNATKMIADGTYPGAVCGAKLRQGEGYCRRPACKGRTRCHLHGGRTPRKDDPPRVLPDRQIRNRNARAARAAAGAGIAAAVESGDLHPETMMIFNRQYARHVAASVRDQFILTLDLRLKGSLSNDTWLATLRQVGLSK